MRDVSNVRGGAHSVLLREEGKSEPRSSLRSREHVSASEAAGKMRAENGGGVKLKHCKMRQCYVKEFGGMQRFRRSSRYPHVAELCSRAGLRCGCGTGDGFAGRTIRRNSVRGDLLRYDRDHSSRALTTSGYAKR